MAHRPFDLEERLLEFPAEIMILAEALPRTRSGNHVAAQIIRCGTSPLSNQGEAQSAESQQDFIHKMKIGLKELRETKRWLALTKRASLIKTATRVDPLLAETEELVKIFFTSIRTAERNRLKPPDPPPQK